VSLDDNEESGGVRQAGANVEKNKATEAEAAPPSPSSLPPSPNAHASGGVCARKHDGDTGDGGRHAACPDGGRDALVVEVPLTPPRPAECDIEIPGGGSPSLPPPRRHSTTFPGGLPLFLSPFPSEIVTRRARETSNCRRRTLPLILRAAFKGGERGEGIAVLRRGTEREKETGHGLRQLGFDCPALSHSFSLFFLPLLGGRERERAAGSLPRAKVKAPETRLPCKRSARSLRLGRQRRKG